MKMGGNVKMNLQQLGESLNAWVESDNSQFRHRARILQSIWREEQGFKCGQEPTRKYPLGSSIPTDGADKSLANFITERTRDVVRLEVMDPIKSKGKVYGKPRIFDNLLSSQPLCFNLFAELRYDLDLASKVVKELTGGCFLKVRSIEFEHSPGRENAKYLEDHTAFDVFLECETFKRRRGLIGIEVKYHENLKDSKRYYENHKKRYDAVAAKMGCFLPEAAQTSAPLEQFWRNHLLAEATFDKDGYDDFLSVVLYPAENNFVKNAATTYRACLTPGTASFTTWTLEDFTNTVRVHCKEKWIDLFIDRYLAFEKIEKRLSMVDGQ
jgi:hypothetical protein